MAEGAGLLRVVIVVVDLALILVVDMAVLLVFKEMETFRRVGDEELDLLGLALLLGHESELHLEVVAQILESLNHIKW